MIEAIAKALGIKPWLVMVCGALLLITAGIVAWNVWLDGHDDEVVANDRNAGNAKIERAAREAGDVATEDMERRAAIEGARSAHEREKVNEAVRNGADPFDVLFPSGGVRTAEPAR